MKGIKRKLDNKIFNGNLQENFSSLSRNQVKPPFNCFAGSGAKIRSFVPKQFSISPPSFAGNEETRLKIHYSPRPLTGENFFIKKLKNLPPSPPSVAGEIKTIQYFIKTIEWFCKSIAVECFPALSPAECKQTKVCKMKIILLDIEGKLSCGVQTGRQCFIHIPGTTTDIRFVKDVLFNYARDYVEEFLNENYDDPEIQEILKDLCELSQQEGCPIEQSSVKAVFVKSVVENVQRQISEDRKGKELKNLQGKIWKRAFEAGQIKGQLFRLSLMEDELFCSFIKGHVYDDVPKNIQKWSDQGIQIFIYSSGSVEAQKLLFGHSVHGNLLGRISGHFDTKVGSKQEAQSYKNIAQEIRVAAGEILFLSDIPNEVIAAESAGMQVAIIDRPDNPTEQSEEIRKRFKVAKTFDEIEF